MVSAPAPGGADPGGADPAPAELLRVHPDVLEVTAQLVWAAAPRAVLLRDEPDAAGLIPLLVRGPLDAAQAAAFERGLDALLREPSEVARGTYLREVRDLRGRRRELGVPCAPAAWRQRPSLIGPFCAEAEARAWQARALPPGWLGDPLRHQGRWYVDAFRGDDDTLRLQG
jgi:hypothetical protein